MTINNTDNKLLNFSSSVNWLLESLKTGKYSIFMSYDKPFWANHLGLLIGTAYIVILFDLAYRVAWLHSAMVIFPSELGKASTFSFHMGATMLFTVKVQLSKPQMFFYAVLHCLAAIVLYIRSVHD